MMVTRTKGWMAGGILLAACAGAAEPPDANEANEMQVADAPGERHGGPGHRRGHGLRMLEEALAQVEMTAEQRQRIDAALAPDEDDRAERREGFRARHEALVLAVRSGDEAALAQATEGLEPRGERFVQTLNEIHRALDAGQRHALVAAIRAQREGHEGRADHPGRGRGRHGRRGFHPEGRRDRMLDDLGLTDDQKTRLDAARAEAGLERPSPEDREAMHEAHRAHFDEMLTAFEQDDFDAARLERAERQGPMARHAAELRVLVPILTAAQRETLAGKMEEHFARGPQGPMGPPGDEGEEVPR